MQFELGPPLYREGPNSKCTKYSSFFTTFCTTSIQVFLRGFPRQNCRKVGRFSRSRRRFCAQLRSSAAAANLKNAPRFHPSGAKSARGTSEPGRRGSGLKVPGGSNPAAAAFRFFPPPGGSVSDGIPDENPSGNRSPFRRSRKNASRAKICAGLLQSLKSPAVFFAHSPSQIPHENSWPDFWTRESKER